MEGGEVAGSYLWLLVRGFCTALFELAIKGEHRVLLGNTLTSSRSDTLVK